MTHDEQINNDSHVSLYDLFKKYNDSHLNKQDFLERKIVDSIIKTCCGIQVVISTYSVSWPINPSGHRWEHTVTFFVPQNLISGNKGMIVLNNGANKENKPIVDDYSSEDMELAACSNGVVVISVNNTLNQPAIRIAANQYFYVVTNENSNLNFNEKDHLFEDDLVSNAILDSLKEYTENSPFIYFTMASVAILTDKMATKKWATDRNDLISVDWQKEMESKELGVFSITGSSKRAVAACLATHFISRSLERSILCLTLNSYTLSAIGDAIKKGYVKTLQNEATAAVLKPYENLAISDNRYLLDDFLNIAIKARWIHTVTYPTGSLQPTLLYKSLENHTGHASSFLTHKHFMINKEKEPINQHNAKELAGSLINDFISHTNNKTTFSIFCEKNSLQQPLKQLVSNISALSTTTNDSILDQGTSLICSDSLLNNTSSNTLVWSAEKR